MAELKFLNSVGATVMINGVEQDSVTVSCGATVIWEVSKEGYATQTGSQEVWEDTVIDVTLELERYEIVFVVSPEDAAMTVNGELMELDGGRCSVTVRWGDTVTWSCAADGYVPQVRGFTATCGKTLYITLDAAPDEDRAVGFVVSPADAELTVNGTVRPLDGDGLFVLTAHDGEVVEWSCSADGYVSKEGSLTVDGNATVYVTLVAEPEPEPEYATLTIKAEPSDADVVINGEGRTRLTAVVGTEIEWRVSKDGYAAQSGTLVLTEDTEIEVTLERAEVQYADIEITEFSYEDIPASGGTVTPTLKYRQTWGWGSETGGGVVEDGAEVAYSGVDEDGSHTEGSLGTTEKDRTQVATARVTVSLNGKSASSSAEVWQEANTATYSGLAFIYWEGEQDETYDYQAHQVTLAGYDTLQWRSWTSGEREMFYPLPNGHCTYTDAEECDWARATSVGYDLDANTSREMRGPHDVIETWVSEGETVSRTRHVYQEGVEYMLHSVTVSVTPEEADVTVKYYDKDGEEQTSSKKGSVTVSALEDTQLLWIAALDGYVSQQGLYIVTEDSTISAVLEPHSLHVSSEAVYFTKDGGEEALTVNATSGWTAELLVSSGTALWLDFSPSSGDEGQTTVTLKAGENTSVARSCALSISGDCGSAVVAVEQEAATAEPEPSPTPDDTLSFSVSSIVIDNVFVMTVETTKEEADIAVGMDVGGQTVHSGETFTLEVDGTSHDVPFGQTVTLTLAAGDHRCTLHYDNASGVTGLTFPVGITFNCGGTDYTLPVATL